jgi:hypothetical protein
MVYPGVATGKNKSGKAATPPIDADDPPRDRVRRVTRRIALD